MQGGPNRPIERETFDNLHRCHFHGGTFRRNKSTWRAPITPVPYPYVEDTSFNSSETEIHHEQPVFLISHERLPQDVASGPTCNKSSPRATGSKDTAPVSTNYWSATYPVALMQTLPATALQLYNEEDQFPRNTHSLYNMTRRTQKSIEHEFRCHPREQFMATGHFRRLQHDEKQNIESVWRCRMNAKARTHV